MDVGGYSPQYPLNRGLSGPQNQFGCWRGGKCLVTARNQMGIPWSSACSLVTNHLSYSGSSFMSMKCYCIKVKIIDIMDNRQPIPKFCNGFEGFYF